MSEDFWKTFWRILITGVTLIMITVSACNMHIDYRIGKAIKEGADPIEARIAFSQNSTTTQIVTSILTKKGGE